MIKKNSLAHEYLRKKDLEKLLVIVGIWAESLWVDNGKQLTIISQVYTELSAEISYRQPAEKVLFIIASKSKTPQAVRYEMKSVFWAALW